MDNPFSLQGDVEIIAHRGFSAEAPENTVAALMAGIEAGADAVEFDIHTAADGTPVLLHDDNVDRTTDGQGRVTELTVGELAELDAGGWFDSSFAGEPLPTLAAALEAVEDPEIRLYAEIKGVRGMEDLDEVVGVVREADRMESTVFISKKWVYLDRIRNAAPEALVGYIVDRPAQAERAIHRASGDRRGLLDFDARILLKDLSWAKRAWDAGTAMACWTVDSVDDAETLLRAGVRRITTNQVETLVRWREDRADGS